MGAEFFFPAIGLVIAILLIWHFRREWKSLHAPPKMDVLETLRQNWTPPLALLNPPPREGFRLRLMPAFPSCLAGVLILSGAIWISMSGYKYFVMRPYYTSKDTHGLVMGVLTAFVGGLWFQNCVQRARRLWRDGIAAPGLVIFAELGNFYYHFLDQNHRLILGNGSVGKYEKLPDDGDVISVLYIPENPKIYVRFKN